MTNTATLEQFIDVKTEPLVYQIERGAVIKFSSAIDLSFKENFFNLADTGTLTEPVIPPTFFRCLEPNPLPFEFPGTRLLDAGSQWKYFHNTKVGDLITVTQSLQNIQQKDGRLGTMTFLTIQIKYTNQHSQLVTSQVSTLISY